MSGDDKSTRHDVHTYTYVHTTKHTCDVITYSLYSVSL